MNIYDISLSYELSAEHKQSPKVIEFPKIYEPIPSFVYPEMPVKFIPEIDFKVLISDEWIAEPKFDGWRVIIVADKNSIKFYSRKGKLIDINLPIQVKTPAVLDGELITRNNSSTYAVNSAVRKNPQQLKIVVFDIPFSPQFRWLTMHLPFYRRREILHEVLKPNEFAEIIQPIPKNFDSFVSLKNEKGIEGVVFKNLYSTYEPNGANWLKLKSEIDFTEALKFLRQPFYKSKK